MFPSSDGNSPDANLQIHCFITPANTKFLLLHEQRSEEQIKTFFNDAYELFTRMQMSPFFNPNERIDSPAFHVRMTHAGQVFSK